MQLNPGEGISTYSSAAKRISILACHPNTAGEIEREKEWEKAEKDTKTMCSYGEAL